MPADQSHDASVVDQFVAKGNIASNPEVSLFFDIFHTFNNSAVICGIYRTHLFIDMWQRPLEKEVDH